MEKLIVLENKNWVPINEINQALASGWLIKNITTGTNGTGICYAYVVLEKGNNLINS